MTDPVVLVAEDNTDDFMLLQRAFRKAQITAVLKWVKDGHDARSYLKGEPPYQDREAHPLPVFLLVDLKMPRMDGFELVSWMRSQPLIRRIPVVVLTSSNQTPDINRAYELGANSYLVKPGRFEDLLQLSDSLRAYWLCLNQNATI